MEPVDLTPLKELIKDTIDCIQSKILNSLNSNDVFVKWKTDIQSQIKEMVAIEIEHQMKRMAAVEFES